MATYKRQFQHDRHNRIPLYQCLESDRYARTRGGCMGISVVKKAKKEKPSPIKIPQPTPPMHTPLYLPTMPEVRHVRLRHSVRLAQGSYMSIYCIRSLVTF